MTPGRPFSTREKFFIRDNKDAMSRGQIAQELGRRFPEDNDGYRSWRSVRSFLYREEGKIDTILQIRIPGSVYQTARAAGMDEDDIRRIARAAILDATKLQEVE